MNEKVSLPLLHKVEKYTKDGVEKSFDKYYIVYNNIELSMQPSDNTVRQVLSQIYTKGGDE